MSNNNLLYKSLFNTPQGQQVLDELTTLFYKPILVQDTVEKTYFRLGSHDVLSYILARVEDNV